MTFSRIDEYQSEARGNALFRCFQFFTWSTFQRESMALEMNMDVQM